MTGSVDVRPARPPAAGDGGAVRPVTWEPHELVEIVVRADDALGVGPGALAERVRAVWRTRELVREFALRDIRLRYREATLGFLWAVFMPIMIVLAGAVFRLVASAGAGGVSAAGFADFRGIVVKAVPWAFFAGAVSFATTSLTSNATLVARIYFPREVLPVAAVGAQLVDLLAGGSAAAIILVALGVRPGLAALWVLPLLVLLVLLTTAVSLVLSCLNLFFRDVKYIVQVLLSFGVFFTPIFFDASSLGRHAETLMRLNPLAPIVEGLRVAVVEGRGLAASEVVAHGTVVWRAWYLLTPVAWVVLGLAIGLALFRRYELTFGERV